MVDPGDGIGGIGSLAAAAAMDCSLDRFRIRGFRLGDRIALGGVEADAADTDPDWVDLVGMGGTTDEVD